MKLDKIEISGFKSFLRRTELQIPDGVTAIVGPNGCGKSNIADAIRWVLGEQSAKSLRGEKMEDVIFNGSARHKPAGMADVTLCFHNEEGGFALPFPRVEITRRVFRNAQSEYQINRAACRLKDIQDLFADTGVGKFGYAILEQGKVEHLIRSHPEDMRQLIEGVAGIAKYKLRRGEAESKIEACQQDLTRAEDIFNEVEKQRNALRRQASRAKRYRAMKGAFLDTVLQLLKLRYDLKVDSLTAERSALAALTARIKDTDSQLKHEEGQHLSLRAAADAAAQEVAVSRSAQHDAERGLEALGSRMDVVQSRLSLISREAEQAAHEAEQTVLRRTRIDQELAAAQHEKEQLGSELRERTVKLQEAGKWQREEDAQIRQVKNEAQEIRRQLLQVEEQLVKLRNRRQSVSVDQARQDTQATRLSSEHEAIAQQISEKKRDSEAAQERLDKLDDDFDKMKRRLEAERARLAAAESVLTEAKSRLDGLRHRAISAESRLSSLQGVLDSYQGFGEAARHLIKSSRSKAPNAGVVALLAETFTPLPGKAAALEGALDGALEDVIVRDLGAARSSFAMLRSGNLGRASLILRDQIPQPNGRPDLSADQGFVGWADQMIKPETQWTELTRWRLGRIGLAADLDSALRLSRAYPQYRFATTDGETVQEGALVRGGSGTAVQTGYLAQKEEVARLRVTLKDLLAQRDSAEEVWQDQDEQVQELKRGLEILRDQSQHLAVQRAAAEKDATNKTDEIKRLQLRATAIDQESAAAADGKAKLVRESEHLDQAIADTETRREEFNRQRTEIQAREEALSAKLSDRRDEVAELRVAVSALQERFTSRERDCQRLAAEAARLATRRDEFEEKTVNRREELTALETTLAQMKHERGPADQRVREAGARLQQAIEAQRQFEQQLKETEVRISQLRAALEKLREQAQARSIAAARLEAEVEGLKTEIENKAHEPADVALQRIVLADTDSVANLETKVREFEFNLEKFGEVNLQAEIQFEEIDRRYTFLQQQLDDLKSSRDTLQETIAKIDATTRLRFMETFEEARGHFRSIFSQLFTGGEADLALTGSDDPLTCGIELLACPPGKRLRSLTLLSGGEKSLTALAFLFALFACKPAPFVLLDEVDAALDESNVIRFADYLRRLSSSAQILIISHNPRTMEVADVVYGVTMDQPGESRVVSVKLAAVPERSDAQPVTDSSASRESTPATS